MSTWTPSGKRPAKRRKNRSFHPTVSLLEPRQLMTGTPAWQQADIGATGGSGWASSTGSSLSIIGSGAGLAGSADAGHFSYVPLTGNGEIDAHLTGGGLETGGQIDLMMRSSLDPSSQDVSVEWTSSGSVQYEHRLTESGWANNAVPYPSQSPQTYLRLVRYGNQVAAYESTDGSSWITVGSDTIALGQTVDVGIFAAGGSAGVSGWASLANVTVGTISQPFTTSWIGNTYGGGDTFVQGQVNAMYVAPGGIVYTNSDWDEGGHESGIYQDGQAIGYLQDTHGWGRTGGTAITSDGQYIYMAMEQSYDEGATGDYPGPGSNWFAVRRYNLDGTPAPFAGGRGWDSSMLLCSVNNPVTGLAVADGQLVVTLAGDNTVVTADLGSMAITSVWWSAQPNLVTADPNGNGVWIASSWTNEINHYSVNGTAYPDSITGVADATAIATTPSGNLLVADDSSARQVIEYAVDPTMATNPAAIARFGDAGGILSGVAGAVTPTKFDGLEGVGMDDFGNLIVNTSAYGTTIRSFAVTPSGNMSNGSPAPTLTQNWEVDGLEFVDIGDIDPASDGSTVYTEFHQYTINQAAPAGQQWTLAATTVDAADYPEDPRLLNTNGVGLGLSTEMIRDVDGVKLMFVADEYSSMLVVYRFVGNIAVPAAMFARAPIAAVPNSPSSGAWLWVDSNGDGAFQANEFQSLGTADTNEWGVSVDANGTIWLTSSTAGVRSIPITGIAADGVPQLNPAAGATVAPSVIPGDFTELTRAVYDPTTDTMYLGGYSWNAPHLGSEWGELGTTIARYNNWSTNPTLAWETLLPYEPNASPSIVVKSMAVAGGKVFAGISQTGQILEYDAATGALDDTIYPGPEVAGNTGWFDTTDAINAYQQTNGQIDVFAEEVTQSKVLEYELTQATPTAVAAVASTSVGTQSIAVSWTAAAGATSYQISRSTDGNNFSVVGTSTTASYTDATAIAGVTYTYSVRAFGTYAESPVSAPATGSIPKAPPASTATTVSISQLHVQSATFNWGLVTALQPQPGPAVGDLAYLGATHRTPVAQYPSADIIYRLNGAYTRFAASTMVDPGGSISGTVTFEVLADGVPIYISPPESAGTPAVPFTLNVTGVSVLDLRVINTGDGTGFDHADWVGPTLVVAHSSVKSGPVTVSGNSGSASSGQSTSTSSTGASTASQPSASAMAASLIPNAPNGSKNSSSGSSTGGSLYAGLPLPR